MKRVWFFTFLLVFCRAPGLVAVAMAGPQFQVNSVNSGDQTAPDLAADDAGNFVVVWTGAETSGPDVSGSSVWARRFDSSGKALADQFLVNTSTTGDQISPAVAMQSNGAFIVVWCSLQSIGDAFYGILAQRYAADGSASGGEFLVNGLTADVQESPSVAISSGGDFLVVWQSMGSGGDDDDLRSIQGRLYTADGRAAGDQFQINSYTAGDQAGADVAALPGGGFIVTWFNVSGSSGSDDDGRSVQAQEVSSAGALIGAEFQVNTFTTSHQYEPSVAAQPDGGFVVVWTSDGSPETDPDYSVLGQRFDTDALPVGPEFQVNTTVQWVQALPSVAATDDGSFLVLWRSGEYSGDGPDGDDYAISGRSFAADGTPDGDEFLVNDVFTGRQDVPALGAAPGGRFIATWQSQSSPGDDTDLSIQARQFGPGALIFSDSFEGGDTGQWDAASGKKKARSNETAPRRRWEVGDE